MSIKQPRQKKCKVCRSLFTPFSTTAKVCSVGCAIEQNRIDRDKKQRKADQKRKQELKPRSKWMKELQTEVNKYVRLRDSKHGCVSCDRPSTWQGQWHASHFRSVGAASAIRFNLWNIHKSCSICNNWKSGNLSDYEPRLRAKIGDKKVDWLKSQNQCVTYSVEYIQRFLKIIKKRIKRLDNSKLLH